MNPFKADLHIHSCLSACAELEMTPLSIIKRAKELSFDIIAISDHNSAENLFAASKIAKKEDIFLIPAMEITSHEEAHILALFGDIESVMEMQSIIYRTLPDIEPIDFGPIYQVVVNENDEILDLNDRMLFGASSLSTKEIVDKIHSLNGIAIASHVDREIFSIISQLGFIPDDIKIDAIEISYSCRLKKALQMLDAYKYLPWIRNSDAHCIAGIGRAYSIFQLERLSFKEIADTIRDKERIKLIKG
ncbi:MAG TPA: PHP domain-containing protein [Nitrospirae bacterium]|nr:PHP domain-containing protein [Nitrospirota bacterium]